MLDTVIYVTLMRHAIYQGYIRLLADKRKMGIL
jgi:hypothetical protein